MLDGSALGRGLAEGPLPDGVPMSAHGAVLPEPNAPIDRVALNLNLGSQAPPRSRATIVI